jgi:SPP1 gp7 family putative phage head morphogenesis protein
VIRLDEEYALSVLDDVFWLLGVDSLVKAEGSVLTRRGFDAVVRALVALLTEATTARQKAAVQRATALLDQRWNSMTGADRELAVVAAARAMKPTFQSSTNDVLTTLGRSVKGTVDATKQAVALKHKLDLPTVFSAHDDIYAQHVVSSNAVYMRDKLGQIVDGPLADVMRKTIAKGVDDGLDNATIARDLEKALSGTAAEQTRSYYTMVASTVTARARAYGELRSFELAGIKRYQVQAVLDEITCSSCRFMHGQEFEVAAALDRFTQAATAPPSELPDIQPFMSQRRIGDTTYLGLRRRHTFEPIASVDFSAAGKKDLVGTYRIIADGPAIQKLGGGCCPFHPHCRCVLIPVFTRARRVLAPPPGPPAPPFVSAAKPYNPTPSVPQVWPAAKLPDNLADLVRPLPTSGDRETTGDFSAGFQAKQAAIAAVQAASPVDPLYPDYIEPPWNLKPPKKSNGAYDLPFDPVKGPAIAAAKKKGLKDIPVAELAPTTVHNVSKAKLIAAIEGQLDAGWFEWNANPEYVVTAKKDGIYFAISNLKGTAKSTKASTAHAHNSAAIALFTKQPTIKGYVVDLDAVKPKAPAKPKKPKTTPPAAAAAPAAGALPRSLKPIAPPGDPANILHTKTGNAKGSNQGGFYRGGDGVERYVKEYADPTQARCEHLANQIYRDLGLGAPESALFEKDGKVLYSSKLFQGGKTLKEAGLTKERAEAFLDGFVGDVLTGNWDAVGTGMDNAFVLADGRIARIDNGGSFLFRAQAGRKPDAVLDKISEWDVFLSSKNPYYQQVANKAGVTEAEDMADVIKRGVDRVLALRKAAGGWDHYVDRVVPGLALADRNAVIRMLNSRTKLLEGKVAELSKPKPALLPKLPGAFSYDPGQLSDVTPRPGLTLADLPEHDLMSKIRAHVTKLTGDGKTTWGEDLDDFRKRTRKALDKAADASKTAIRNFTNGGYSELRETEMGIRPDGGNWGGKANSHWSDQITRAFDVVPGEQTTVFRGARVTPDRASALLRLHLESEEWGLGYDGKGATTSTSWDLRRAENFGALGTGYAGGYSITYKLRTKTGIAIETISNYTNEREILIPKTARFRTTGLSIHKGTNGTALIVEADEI